MKTSQHINDSFGLLRSASVARFALLTDFESSIQSLATVPELYKQLISLHP